MKPHFQTLAAYNQWANARLYEAAATLPDAQYRQPTGVFFGSLHGTLNHLLVADRMWLARMSGQPNPPTPLNAIVYENLADLAAARTAEDARVIALINATPPESFAQTITYQNTAGTVFKQKLQDILTHFFNHQTHHRGQAHACLSVLTGAEPPSLDLLIFQRGAPTPPPKPS
jgi:uncharacterized damage-inducible protein DinB